MQYPLLRKPLIARLQDVVARIQRQLCGQHG